MSWLVWERKGENEKGRGIIGKKEIHEESKMQKKRR